MGRKPNPRGKDRTRTISLDGDVAEIAQKLADKSQLSAVLSQLLRQNYGISDELSQLKQVLSATIDERKNLQEKELQMIEQIEAAEERLIHKQNHILPSLYQRQGIIEERLRRLGKEERSALDDATRNRKIALITENKKLLEAVLDEIKELEL